MLNIGGNHQGREASAEARTPLWQSDDGAHHRTLGMVLLDSFSGR